MTRAVIKVGTSSLTSESGEISLDAVAKLVAELAEQRSLGHEVVLVSSGAIAAGMPALNMQSRPTDLPTLQALAAVGQSRLMRAYDDAFAAAGLVSGQVLLAGYDFGHRRQYLQARATLQRLLALGVVPIVNENDAVANDEIRFGDNDRIAALVAHSVAADVLLLLTDTAGVFSADPRVNDDASLIEEIAANDADLAADLGGSGTQRGSGGMASKVAAARMAQWAGIDAVIAAAGRRGVVRDVMAGVAGVGTRFTARAERLTARKLWIGFALPAEGTIVVDAGAARALLAHGRSLLPAGVVSVEGDFDADAAVEVLDHSGRLVAKGLACVDSQWVRSAAGKRTDELGVLADSGMREVIHRDDLVILAD